MVGNTNQNKTTELQELVLSARECRRTASMLYSMDGNLKAMAVASGKASDHFS